MYNRVLLSGTADAIGSTLRHGLHGRFARQRLGYQPQDNAERYVLELLQSATAQRSGPLSATSELQNEWPFQSGSFCDEEFAGDISRID